MKIARLITTFDCHRKCSYCVNKHETIREQMREVSIPDLKGYDVVMVTGGEPLLNPGKTLSILREIKAQSAGRPIYLYTTLYRLLLWDILSEIDGLNFTMHGGSNEERLDLIRVQELLRSFPGSHKLHLSPAIDKQIGIIPHVWSQIKMKVWMGEGECKVPEGEELLILDGD